MIGDCLSKTPSARVGVDGDGAYLDISIDTEALTPQCDGLARPRMSDPDIAAKLDGPGRKRTWLRHIDQRQHIRHVSRPERSAARVEIVWLWEVHPITNHLNNWAR